MAKDRFGNAIRGAYAALLRELVDRAPTGARFNLIDLETNERARMQIVNIRGEAVERSSLVKGHPCANNQYVPIP
jgi:non-homologous end joining protein Ku